MRILYLDIDTLRPDHLGCYGYRRDTSPNIDWIASEGVIFDQYYTTDAPCLPSRSALMTGTFGIHNGVVNHGGHNADFRIEGQRRGFTTDSAYHNLPAYLKHEAKIRTAYIGGFGERHATYNYYTGFREIIDTGKGGNESAEDVTPIVMEWLDKNGASDNWYLHVNYWDPHTPYRAPEEFGNPFENEPLPEWITEDVIQQHIAETVGPHGVAEVNMYSSMERPQFPREVGKIESMADVKKLIDGYDCGIRYADEHVGMLLEKLKALGVLDDLVIIVSSDHGENFGELGIWAEHATADYGTSRIPMVIKWPNGVKNHVDTGLHYNIDLLPTLADLLNQKQCTSWDGQSYVETITKGSDAGRDELILSQCCHGCQRSVRFGDWLYIRTYHDFYHLYPKEMLFNVKDDPHEQNDLAKKHPEICADAVARYMNWHDDMMFTQPAEYYSDPLWEVIHRGGPFHSRGKLSNYIQRLKESNREKYVEELIKRHPNEIKNSK